MGAYVTPTTYFKVPRERRKKTDEKSLQELEDARKMIAEQEVVLEKYDTRIHLQDKVIYELVDRIGKLEAAVGEKGKVSEERGSCTGNPPRQELEEKNEDVIFVEKETTLQGKSVALMLRSSKMIVAYGTVYVSGDKLHNAPMPKDCLRVSIDEVVDESALLPFPISDETMTVGSALGTHVAWPTRLVMAKVETRTQKKALKRVEKTAVTEKSVHCYASLPSSLKALYRVMEKSYDGRGMHISLDNDVFDTKMLVWILQDMDVIPFCNLEPITANCIIAYVCSMNKNTLKLKLMRFVRNGLLVSLIICDTRLMNSLSLELFSFLKLEYSNQNINCNMYGSEHYCN